MFACIQLHSYTLQNIMPFCVYLEAKLLKYTVMDM